MSSFAIRFIGFVLLLSEGAQSVFGSWDFETEKTGEMPSGWVAAKTGEGPGSVRKIVEDQAAPKGSKVLAQTSSDGPKALFNLCIAENTSLTDVDLSVSFKAVEGEIDKGGGLVWRYQDANNYYVCRMNPVEANFRVYKVIGGKRTQLATAQAYTEAGQWEKIRVVHNGDAIQCYLADKLLLEAKDNAIQKPGKIGLWTKADAVTYFDDLKANAIQPK